MWSICRIDDGEYFEVQAAYRKYDLDFVKARESGFVGPDDEIALIRPDGTVRAIDEA